MNQYPEHEKLKKVQDISQHIHEFFEFLQDKELILSKWCEERGGVFMPASERLTTLVAEFLDIDEKKLEKEKRQMIEEYVQGSKDS